MNRLIFLTSVCFILTACNLNYPKGKAREVRKIVHFSPAFQIDKIYRSMEGPSAVETIKFPGAEKGDLIWIRSISSIMMDGTGENQLDDNLMCHVNVDFDPTFHNKKFKSRLPVTSRMLTLSQGQMGLYFPKGFGFPVLADEPFSLNTQVLNLNDPKLNTKVRHKISIEYELDKELDIPLKPLFTYAPYVMALIEGEHGQFGRKNNDLEIQGKGCLPGKHAPQSAIGHILQDGLGKKFSGHFVVPPGKQEYITNVTHQFQLLFDTTIHAIAVHVHPFSESLEFRDLTLSKTIFKSKSINLAENIGLLKVEDFSSVEGISVKSGHQYQLKSLYNNTSKKDQDSMAVMLIFMLDKEFKHPTRPNYMYDFQREEYIKVSSSDL